MSLWLIVSSSGFGGACIVPSSHLLSVAEIMSCSKVGSLSSSGLHSQHHVVPMSRYSIYFWWLNERMVWLKVRNGNAQWSLEWWENLKKGPLEQSLDWTLINSECEWCFRRTVRRLHVLPKDWDEMWGGAELDDLLASYEIFQPLVPWTRYSASVITLFFCPIVLWSALLVYYWVLSLQAKWSNQTLWDRSSFIIWEPKVRALCLPTNIGQCMLQGQLSQGTSWICEKPKQIRFQQSNMCGNWNFIIA